MTAKWLILLVVVAALSSIPVACGASSKQPAPAHQKTFKDSTGEAPSGDIKKVTVSNDALGVLTFQVAFAVKLPVRPRVGESQALGTVSAVSTSSITVSELTCAVPDTAASEVADVKVGDRVGIRCASINGQRTLVDGKEWTVVVYFDTDRNTATAARAPFGAEFALVVSRLREDAKQSGFHFEYSLRRWDGKRFTEVSSGSTSGAPRLTVELNSYVLGRRAKGFDFAVATKYGSLPMIDHIGSTWPIPINVAHLRAVDRAPDPGQAPWRFDMKLKPVQVSVTGFTTRPKTPKAGRQIYATTSIEASAAGHLTATLDGSCSRGTVDGRPLIVGYGMDLTGEESTTEAKVECHWDVPADGIGKLFRGSVRLSFRGKSLTRSFSARITR